MNEYYDKPNTSQVIVRNAMPKKNSNLAVGSLVFSIFGFIGFWIPVWNLIFSIAGFVTGLLCITKKHPNRTMAIIGTVISSVALFMSLIACVFYIIAILRA